VIPNKSIAQDTTLWKDQLQTGSPYEKARASLSLAAHLVPSDTLRANELVDQLSLQAVPKDSLLSLQEEKLLYFKQTGDFDKAYRWIKEVLSTTRQEQDSANSILWLKKGVELCFQWYKLDNALLEVDTLVDYLKNSSYQIDHAVALRQKSSILYARSEFEESLELIFQSIERSQHLNNDKQLALSYLHLGNLYYFLDKIFEAEEFYLIGRKHFQQVGDSLGVAFCNSNLGLIAIRNHDFKEAIKLELLALPFLLKNNDEIPLGNLYHYLAEAYLGAQQYDSSSYYVEKSILSNKKTQYLSGLAFDLLIKAKIALATNNSSKVIPYIKEAESMISKQPSTEAEKEIAYFLAGYYGKKKDYYNSYLNFEKYCALLDSLEIDEKPMKLLALDKKLKINQLRYELKLAQEKTALHEKENKLRTKQIIVVSIVACAAILSLLFSLYIIRKNKKLNRELALQKDHIKSELLVKQALLSEVHHRVKNNLQIISSMLSIQSQYIDDQKLEIIVEECRNRINSMSLIHESLYHRENKQQPKFSDYVKKLIPQLVATYLIDKSKIKLEMEIASMELPMDDSLPCGLIINEVVSNSLKHAFPNNESGIIYIKMYEEEGMVVLNIGDNGAGVAEQVDPTRQDTFGFLLIYTLADQLEAAVKVVNENGLHFEFRWQKEHNSIT
jgi:two-component sensor histidine kinase